MKNARVHTQRSIGNSLSKPRCCDRRTMAENLFFVADNDNRVIVDYEGDSIIFPNQRAFDISYRHFNMARFHQGNC